MEVIFGEDIKVSVTPALGELALRVQCLEKAILRVSIVGMDYSNELARVGLGRIQVSAGYGKSKSS